MFPEAELYEKYNDRLERAWSRGSAQLLRLLRRETDALMESGESSAAWWLAENVYSRLNVSEVDALNVAFEAVRSTLAFANPIILYSLLGAILQDGKPARHAHDLATTWLSFAPGIIGENYAFWRSRILLVKIEASLTLEVDLSQIEDDLRILDYIEYANDVHLSHLRRITEAYEARAGSSALPRSPFLFSRRWCELMFEERFKGADHSEELAWLEPTIVSFQQAIKEIRDDIIRESGLHEEE